MVQEFCGDRVSVGCSEKWVTKIRELERDSPKVNVWCGICAIE